MTEDIEQLISAAERVSRVWRQGEAKTKDNLRNAFNELDWTLRYVREKRGKESTRVIHRDDVRLDHAGE